MSGFTQNVFRWIFDRTFFVFGPIRATDGIINANNGAIPFVARGAIPDGSEFEEVMDEDEYKKEAILKRGERLEKSGLIPLSKYQPVSDISIFQKEEGGRDNLDEDWFMDPVDKSGLSTTGAFITDEVIGALLEADLKTALEESPYGPDGNILFINSDAFQEMHAQFTDGAGKIRPTPQDPEYMPSVFEKHEKLIWPRYILHTYNSHGVHWILLLLDTYNRHVFTFDSSRNAVVDTERAALKSFTRILDNLQEHLVGNEEFEYMDTKVDEMEAKLEDDDENLPLDRSWEHTRVKVPQQADRSNTCALWTVINARKVLEKISFNEGDEGASDSLALFSDWENFATDDYEGKDDELRSHCREEYFQVQARKSLKNRDTMDRSEEIKAVCASVEKQLNEAGKLHTILDSLEFHRGEGDPNEEQCGLILAVGKQGQDPEIYALKPKEKIMIIHTKLHSDKELRLEDIKGGRIVGLGPQEKPIDPDKWRTYEANTRYLRTTLTSHLGQYSQDGNAGVDMDQFQTHIEVFNLSRDPVLPKICIYTDGQGNAYIWIGNVRETQGQKLTCSLMVNGMTLSREHSVYGPLDDFAHIQFSYANERGTGEEKIANPNKINFFWFRSPKYMHRNWDYIEEDGQLHTFGYPPAPGTVFTDWPKERYPRASVPHLNEHLRKIWHTKYNTPSEQIKQRLKDQLPSSANPTPQKVPRFGNLILPGETVTPIKQKPPPPRNNAKSPAKRKRDDDDGEYDPDVVNETLPAEDDSLFNGTLPGERSRKNAAKELMNNRNKKKRKVGVDDEYKPDGGDSEDEDSLSESKDSPFNGTVPGDKSLQKAAEVKAGKNKKRKRRSDDEDDYRPGEEESDGDVDIEFENGSVFDEEEKERAFGAARKFAAGRKGGKKVKKVVDTGFPKDGFTLAREIYGKKLKLPVQIILGIASICAAPGQFNMGKCIHHHHRPRHNIQRFFTILNNAVASFCQKENELLTCKDALDCLESEQRGELEEYIIRKLGSRRASIWTELSCTLEYWGSEEQVHQTCALGVCPKFYGYERTYEYCPEDCPLRVLDCPEDCTLHANGLKVSGKAVQEAADEAMAYNQAIVDLFYTTVKRVFGDKSQLERSIMRVIKSQTNVPPYWWKPLVFRQGQKPGPKDFERIFARLRSWRALSPNTKESIEIWPSIASGILQHDMGRIVDANRLRFCKDIEAEQARALGAEVANISSSSSAASTTDTNAPTENSGSSQESTSKMARKRKAEDHPLPVSIEPKRRRRATRKKSSKAPEVSKDAEMEVARETGKDSVEEQLTPENISCVQEDDDMVVDSALDKVTLVQPPAAEDTDSNTSTDIFTADSQLSGPLGESVMISPSPSTSGLSIFIRRKRNLSSLDLRDAMPENYNGPSRYRKATPQNNTQPSQPQSPSSLEQTDFVPESSPISDADEEEYTPTSCEVGSMSDRRADNESLRCDSQVRVEQPFDTESASILPPLELGSDTSSGYLADTSRLSSISSSATQSLTVPVLLAASPADILSPFELDPPTRSSVAIPSRKRRFAESESEIKDEAEETRKRQKRAVKEDSMVSTSKQEELLDTVAASAYEGKRWAELGTEEKRNAYRLLKLRHAEVIRVWMRERGMEEQPEESPRTGKSSYDADGEVEGA